MFRSSARQITVVEPTKTGEGIQACISYKVKSSGGILSSAGVPRTYADFEWLYKQLSLQYPGYIIPPLPETIGAGGLTPLPEMLQVAKTEKQESGGGGTDGYLLSMIGGADYLETRRSRLERFLHRVDSHETLKSCPSVAIFLEAAQVEFIEAKSENTDRSLQVVGDGISSMIGGLSQWIGETKERLAENETVKKMSSSMGMPLDDRVKTAEDLEYDQVWSSIDALDKQLELMHNSVLSFSKTFPAMHTFTGALMQFTNGDASAMSGATMSSLSELSEKHTASLTATSATLGEEVADQVQLVKAAKGALQVREDWRFQMQAWPSSLSSLPPPPSPLTTLLHHTTSTHSSSLTPLLSTHSHTMQVREDRRFQMQAWRETVVAKLNTGAEVGEARSKLDEAELDFYQVHSNAIADCKRYHAGMGETGKRLVLMFSKLIAGVDR
jgi:hypothetical protein